MGDVKLAAALTVKPRLCECQSSKGITGTLARQDDSAIERAAVCNFVQVQVRCWADNPYSMCVMLN